MNQVIIVGGGIAGLVTGIRLAKWSIPCLVIEKKTYPFHRVCGEYISNEATPFLKSEGLYPQQLIPTLINQFKLSSVSGKISQLPLELGGFGISRFSFDNFLFEQAKAAGVEFLLDTEVLAITFTENGFQLKTHQQELFSPIVVGSFGKRSRLDAHLDRNFFKKRSPFVGVKYHARTNHSENCIALHNFRGGYCGISNVEAGKTNICYLTHRDNLKHSGGIEEMQQAILYENPHLKKIFTEADFLFNKPETINEISFETKEPVWHHMLMTGDAAGMIAPLCGNGMAMAIHSAKILSELIRKHLQAEKFSRQNLEAEYTYWWNKAFVRRLWLGRQIQNKLFGTPFSSNLAVNLAVYSKPIAQLIIRKTHGAVF
jgi:menaquinone-9 beta-reductase